MIKKNNLRLAGQYINKAFQMGADIGLFLGM